MTNSLRFSNKITLKNPVKPYIEIQSKYTEYSFYRNIMVTVHTESHNRWVFAKQNKWKINMLGGTIACCFPYKHMDMFCSVYDETSVDSSPKFDMLYPYGTPCIWQTQFKMWSLSICHYNGDIRHRSISWSSCINKFLESMRIFICIYIC